MFFKNKIKRMIRNSFGKNHLSNLGNDSRNLIIKIKDAKLTYLSEQRLASIAETCANIEKLGLDGIFIEAGCALGGSSVLIAKTKAIDRRFNIYDVFGMIPPPTAEDTPDVHERYREIAAGNSKGINGDPYYGYAENLEETVGRNLRDFGVNLESVRMIKGLLQETMNIDQPVAFAHIDVDWHDPVKACLERIFPRLVPGGSIILDDYHDWGGCRKATDEFLLSNPGVFSADDSRHSLKITRIQGSLSPHFPPKS